MKYKTPNLDDAVLGVAYVLGLAQYVLIFRALHFGLGKAASVTFESEMVSSARVGTAGQLETVMR